MTSRIWELRCPYGKAPFYGTHDGKKNIKRKDDPDFRPDPPKAPKSVAPLAMK